MISMYDKFVRLLRLEVESLHDEIEIILHSLDKRLADHEITDYVRNENCAVLRKELLGLEDFLHAEFGGADQADATIEEIADEVQAYLRARMAERDYVPAIYRLVNRRMEKIIRYLAPATPVR